MHCQCAFCAKKVLDTTNQAIIEGATAMERHTVFQVTYSQYKRRADLPSVRREALRFASYAETYDRDYAAILRYNGGTLRLGAITIEPHVFDSNGADQ
jgi:hypothetical protein